MFSPIKLLILGIATLTLAAPALQPQTSADVYKRAPITDVICGTGDKAVRYTVAEIEKALSALGKNMNEGKSSKPKSDYGTLYPHKFHDELGRSSDVANRLEDSPNSKKKVKNTTYLEFPLMHDEYEGGEPGPDRVIAIVYGQKSGDYYDYYFRMVATHRGAVPKEELVPCDPA